MLTLTALIVDDEPIIRRGLRVMLPWAALGFDEVLDAPDAESALALAAERPISLVITDICMPGIDGLELTQRFMAMQPRISIIVITGYDRFEYAQRCCALGVQRLILKPIDEVEMTRALAAEVERLRQLGSEAEERLERQRRAQLSERMLREQLLKRMSQGHCQPGDDADTRTFLRLGPQAGLYAAVIRPAEAIHSDWRSHQDLLEASIEHFVGQALSAQGLGWCFRDGHGEVLALLGPRGETESTLEELARLVEVEYGLEIGVGISDPVYAVAEARGAFAQARMRLEQAQLPGGRDGSPSQTARQIVRQAMEIIKQRYPQNLSVTVLAAELHISPSYFSRMFKRVAGTGCNEYITRTRIRAAKEHLVGTDMRCYEIAEAVGYHDTNYFSLAFKKNTGISPEQYRMAAKHAGAGAEMDTQDTMEPAPER